MWPCQSVLVAAAAAVVVEADGVQYVCSVCTTCLCGAMTDVLLLIGTHRWHTIDVDFVQCLMPVPEPLMCSRDVVVVVVLG